jgi:flagella basal body P-ring formation protein FlgA
MIPGRVAQLVGAEADAVRVLFEDAAKDLLDTPTAGRVVDITPSGMADRLPLAIRVFEKDRIVAQGSVRVAVSVRREVLVAKNPLKRGDTMELKDAAIEARWVGPTFQGASPEDFGSVVRAGKLSPGQLITDADLTPAVVVRKGEMVSVSCVAGSVVVKTMARASSDARRGEVIRFEGEEKSDKGKERSRRVFLARVAGPGRAVTVAASAEEAAPQEAAP